MKITQGRLKQIIKEEMERFSVKEIDNNKLEQTNIKEVADVNLTDEEAEFLNNNLENVVFQAEELASLNDQIDNATAIVEKNLSEIAKQLERSLIPESVKSEVKAAIQELMSKTDKLIVLNTEVHQSSQNIVNKLNDMKTKMRPELKEAEKLPEENPAAAVDILGEPDEEGGMARNELAKISKYGDEIRNMLSDNDQLPAWVQSKITKCAMMIGDVKHFLEGEMSGTPPKHDEPNLQMTLEKMIAEELAAILEKKKVNPWAVCTTSVGREDKAKYERCVMDVKKQQGMK